MSDDTTPQTYLITPPDFELASFPDRLASVLDAHPVACVRLSMATQDETRISRAADALREVCHARDVAIVIESHLLLVEPLGLDGAHLQDGARTVRHARKTLDKDAIVGTFCATSRHDGMSAAEAGADYVSFGPLGQSVLNDGKTVEREVFEFWSEMIEVPVVAEGALSLELVREYAPFTDFFAFADEIWAQDDAADALQRLLSGYAG